MCLFADQLPVDIPNAGNGECCAESMLDGPQACACWKPVYDRPQSPDLRADELPMTVVPPRLCPDCAYRPGSPERSGDERQQCSGDGELDELVFDGVPFYCHVGCLRVIRLVHGPSGTTYEPQGDYRPPIAANSAASGHMVPYQADGTPARICSGWFLRRQAWLRTIAREVTADA